MWLGTKRMKRLPKNCLSLVSKPRHINSIFTVNTPILYILCALFDFSCFDFLSSSIIIR